MAKIKSSRLAREIAEMKAVQRRLGIKALPSEMREPNKITAETIAKSEQGEDVYRFDNAAAMFKDLGI